MPEIEKPNPNPAPAPAAPVDKPVEPVEKPKAGENKEIDLMAGAENTDNKKKPRTPADADAFNAAFADLGKQIAALDAKITQTVNSPSPVDKPKEKPLIERTLEDNDWSLKGFTTWF